MNFSHALLTVLVAWNGPSAGQIRVEGALTTLIEQIDVPRREAGVLAATSVREGELVVAGTELAKIDDADAQLLKDRARIELESARKEAENNVSVRFAAKSTEVAKAEMRRATESIEKYRKSISESELDRLRLAAERAVLEVEQAGHEFELAQFKRQLKENDLQMAARNLELRRIVAPIDGVVVQMYHRKGEWVEPGESVLRMLRIDRLRVEGFLSVQDVRQDLNGFKAIFTVDLPGQPRAEFAGKLVFVSPEIDPVNRQIRVWAEVENRDLQLRPGLQGTLTIDLAAPRRNP